MRMLRTSVNLQLLAHCTAKRVLGEHALNSVLNNALGMLLHGLGERLALQTTGITAVAVVFLGRSLGARNPDLVGVDDDDEVTRVNMRGVLRLVLTLEKLCSLGSNAAKDLILGIDNQPFALNFKRLCLLRFHFKSSTNCDSPVEATDEKVFVFKSASLTDDGFLRHLTLPPAWTPLAKRSELPCNTGLLKANFCIL